MQHLRVCVIGNVDSGKSTLVGVLAKGQLDNGRGFARQFVLNGKHEQETGQTSSITHELIGYDQQGKQVIPQHYSANKNKFWREIVQNSSKIVHLIDLCGHHEYLKTTITGMIQSQANYSIILIGANTSIKKDTQEQLDSHKGIQKITKEHLILSLFQKIPIIIVFTKIDIAPENIYKDNLESIKSLIKSPLIKKMPVQMGNNVEEWIDKFVMNQIVPIFEVSNVSGYGIPLLHQFLQKLPNTDLAKNIDPTQPFQMNVEDTFLVPGQGIVAHGLVVSGTVKLGQQVFLGPELWRLMSVKSIQVWRTPFEESSAGKYTCLLIRPIKQTDGLTRKDFRKGSVLVDNQLISEAVREFWGNVTVLFHATLIKQGYKPTFQCGCMKQPVEFVEIVGRNELQSGQQGLVRFRFLQRGEFIKIGQKFVIREGESKLFGQITDIIKNQ